MNNAYYDAFDRGDLAGPDGLLGLSTPDIVCIAPLGNPAFGAEAVGACTA
ncbi:MAG: hypothetical protein U0Y82_12780 [Thermoleophilia bacterium]